ncbi:Rap1a/Tai family immunity protein [Sphingobium aquiterrae]|uniref:Rap1a/Tai family immunity protein n=1 Tax=Sphingobium aquiterrae TaxID=2038656 RepID=UPI003015AB36
MFAALLAAVAGAAAPAPQAVSAPRPAAAAPASSASDIGYLTAQQLSAKCRSSASAEVSYCFAYIAAVTDSARAYEIWLSAREFCLPAGIAQSEVRSAFMTYVSAYPSDSSGQAASVVINALKQTYPCG